LKFEPFFNSNSEANEPKLINDPFWITFQAAESGEFPELPGRATTLFVEITLTTLLPSNSTILAWLSPLELWIGCPGIGTGDKGSAGTGC